MKKKKLSAKKKKKADVVETTVEEKKKFNLKQLLDNVRSVLVNVFVIVTIILAIIYFIKQLGGKSIEVGHIGIPEELIKKGYSEQVVGNLVKDHLIKINNLSVFFSSKKFENNSI